MTVLPEYVVRTEIEAGVLRAIPVEGRPLRRTLKLVWAADGYFSPIAYAFLFGLSDEYPALAAEGIRNTGSLNRGGAVATAGNLVFIGATVDEKFRAFDKYTGRILWEYQLPAGGYATPSVYTINGKQYVVIAAGGAAKPETRPGDAIIAFALPD